MDFKPARKQNLDSAVDLSIVITPGDLRTLEIPEPSARVLQVAALATVGLVVRKRRRGWILDLPHFRRHSEGESGGISDCLGTNTAKLAGASCSQAPGGAR